MSNQNSVIRLYSYIAGACDFITGVFLICSPIFVLTMLSVPDAIVDVVYLKYIGAFVLSVGLSYFLPVLFSNSESDFLSFTYHVWLLTSMIRLVISAFVLIQVLSGNLHLNWLIVAVTDCSLAMTQIFGIRFFKLNLKIER